MTGRVAEAERRDIEALYEAFNRRDVDAFLERVDSQVKWANGMEGGYVEGRDAVRDYWIRQFETIEPRVEPEEIRGDEDGRIMVNVHQVVHSSSGQLLADETVVHRFTFRDRQIVRFDIVI